MLDLWRQGHQVVYGIRRSTDEGAVTSWSRRAFYRLIATMSEDDLPLNAGEFRLVDACILAQLRTVIDTSPYMRGLISSQGFSKIGFAYDCQARVAGMSKLPFKAMLGRVGDGLLTHLLFTHRQETLSCR